MSDSVKSSHWQSPTQSSSELQPLDEVLPSFDAINPRLDTVVKSAASLGAHADSPRKSPANPDSQLLNQLFPPVSADGSSLDVDVPFPELQIELGHFTVEERIGVGGMGAVFRALDTRLQRVVALKVLGPAQSRDASAVRRFQNEARSAARLDHDNIARVFYFGEDKGLHFIAFEYVVGINLRDLIQKRGPLPIVDALNYTLQIASALSHTAANGVVHRDIKPSNIIVMPNGRTKLVDLGLARKHTNDSLGDITIAGTTLGTFDYISPEQAKDPRNVDVRSDIYSLGCTLYHLLTGSPPYPEGTVLQKLLDHQGKDPPDPAALNPQVPNELSNVVRRMMATRPRNRHATPQDLIAELAPIAHAFGMNSIPSESLIWSQLAPRTERFWERNLGWIVPIVLLIGIVLSVEYWPMFTSRESVPTEAGTPHAAWRTNRRPSAAPADTTKTESRGERRQDPPVPTIPPQPLSPSESRADRQPAVPGFSTETDNQPPDGPSPRTAGDDNPTRNRNSAVSAATLQPNTSGGPALDRADQPASIGSRDKAWDAPMTAADDTGATSESEWLLPDAWRFGSSPLDVFETPLGPLAVRPEFPSIPFAPPSVGTGSTGRRETVPANDPSILTPATTSEEETKPFRVLSADGSQSELRSTLEAAFAAASDGSVIEIRQTAPQPVIISETIRLQGKKITMRGTGPGLPHLVFAPSEEDGNTAAEHLFELTEASIDFVNLQISLQLPPSAYDGEAPKCLLQLQGASSVQLQQVLITVRNPGNRPCAVIELVPQPAATVADNGMMMKTRGGEMPAEFGITMRRSLIRGNADVIALYHTQPGRISLDQSAMVVDGTLLFSEGNLESVPKSARVELRFTHATVVVGNGLLNFDAGDTPRDLLPVEVKLASNNLFATHTTQPFVQIRGRLESDVVDSLVSWHGEKNFYDGFDVFWQASEPTSESRDFQRWIDVWSQTAGARESAPQKDKVIWSRDWSRTESADVIPRQLRLNQDASNPAINGASDGTDIGVDLTQLPAPAPTATAPTSTAPPAGQ